MKCFVCNAMSSSCVVVWLPVCFCCLVAYVLLQARNLPGMDWWNGLADPYVVITAMPAGVEPILYK